MCENTISIVIYDDVIVVDGDTYNYRGVLKTAGFVFDKSRKTWFKRSTNVEADLGKLLMSLSSLQKNKPKIRLVDARWNVTFEDLRTYE